MVDFDTTLDGVTKYINTYICKDLNDWQDVIVHMAIGRIYNNKSAIKQMMINNGYVRALGVVDKNCNIDVENLLVELKAEVERKQKVSVSVPLIGTMTFKPADVDTLKNIILEETKNENNENT